MMKKAIAILIGSACIGVGINGFIVPYHLLDGGMIGLGLVAHYVWGVQAGLAMITASIPIYIVAWIYYRHYFFNSIHGLLASSFFIDFFQPLSKILHLPLLYSSIIGGAFIGIGIGLMLKHESSTGGLDLLAQFISSYLPINVGFIILFFDCVILFLAINVIPINSFYYSALTITSVAIFTAMINRHNSNTMIDSTSKNIKST